MTATRKPQRVFDQRPRFKRYVPVGLRLAAGKAPEVRMRLAVRTGRPVASQSR